LTRGQIDHYKLPPNRAKTGDSRYRAYKAKHGQDSWELDALEPTGVLPTEESSPQTAGRLVGAGASARSTTACARRVARHWAAASCASMRADCHNSRLHEMVARTAWARLS
jgi:hypothetical protein